LSYKGSEPFHLFIKKYFKQNKKHGAKDRKWIAALCYDYFRLGTGVIVPMSLEEKIVLAHFLIQNTPSPLLQELNPAFAAAITSPLSEKLAMVKEVFEAEKIFPFTHELEPAIQKELFSISFLKQPHLFLRIRNGFADQVESKLKNAGVDFTINNNCIELSPSTKASEILLIDKEAVVQDRNSQMISALFPEFEKPSLAVWDCCAASGGKSILAVDHYEKIDLTVSDTRKSILKNLSARFEKAGIKKYHSLCIDLSKALFPGIFKNKFDLIIADVPCSGSGTWSRTPEQLQFFREEEIEQYSSLQRKLVAHALPFLKKNGYLLYITCSVFEKENKKNTAWLEKNADLKILDQKHFKGYECNADTLFAALLQKQDQ